MNLLIVILVLILVFGAFGGGHMGYWPARYGYGGGGLGLVLLIVVVLILLGRV
jgi:hypothetical protein